MRKVAIWVMLVTLAWLVWQGIQQVSYELERVVSFPVYRVP